MLDSVVGSRRRRVVHAGPLVSVCAGRCDRHQVAEFGGLRQASSGSCTIAQPRPRRCCDQRLAKACCRRRSTPRRACPKLAEDLHDLSTCAFSNDPFAHVERWRLMFLSLFPDSMALCAGAHLHSQGAASLSHARACVGRARSSRACRVRHPFAHARGCAGCGQVRLQKAGEFNRPHNFASAFCGPKTHQATWRSGGGPRAAVEKRADACAAYHHLRGVETQLRPPTLHGTRCAPGAAQEQSAGEAKGGWS